MAISAAAIYSTVRGRRPKASMVACWRAPSSMPMLVALKAMRTARRSTTAWTTRRTPKRSSSAARTARTVAVTLSTGPTLGCTKTARTSRSSLMPARGDRSIPPRATQERPPGQPARRRCRRAPTQGRLQIPASTPARTAIACTSRTVGGRGGRWRRFPTVGPIASAGSGRPLPVGVGDPAAPARFEGPTTLDRLALSGGSSSYVVAVAPPVVPTR